MSTHPGRDRARSTRPGALVVLGAILALESLGLAALTVLLIVLTLAEVPEGSGLVTSVALIVLTAGAAVGLGLVARGTFRRQAWSRPAALVWQLMQLLVGVYAFQPPGARVDLGLLAVVPAGVALVLLFTRSVRDATYRE